MARKARLGSGKRFKSLSRKVGSKALAAYIGRKKYGKRRMAKMAAAGRRRKSRGRVGTKRKG